MPNRFCFSHKDKETELEKSVKIYFNKTLSLEPEIFEAFHQSKWGPMAGFVTQDTGTVEFEDVPRI